MVPVTIQRKGISQKASVDLQVIILIFYKTTNILTVHFILKPTRALEEFIIHLQIEFTIRIRFFEKLLNLLTLEILVGFLKSCNNLYILAFHSFYLGALILTFQSTSCPLLSNFHWQMHLVNLDCYFSPCGESSQESGGLHTRGQSGRQRDLSLWHREGTPQQKSRVSLHSLVDFGHRQNQHKYYNPEVSYQLFILLGILIKQSRERSLCVKSCPFS